MPVSVFCPRAYRRVFDLACRGKTIRIAERRRSAMPVLKAPPKQAKTTVVQLRLDDEARTKLTKYAEFLDCSPSYVVTEALKLVYLKDKEFQSWLSGHHTNASESAAKGESFHLELK
jgi:predicted transcriptional regulator